MWDLREDLITSVIINLKIKFCESKSSKYI